MKPNAVTCLLLIACVLNLLFGCSHRKAVPLPELEQAEAVMFEHPDSALHILHSVCRSLRIKSSTLCGAC